MAKLQCRARVIVPGFKQPLQCSFVACGAHEGKWLCRKHHPDYREQWEAEHNKTEEERLLEQRIQRYAPDMYRILVRLNEGRMDVGALADELLRKLHR